jgi:adenine-specific DNA methylase
VHVPLATSFVLSAKPGNEVIVRPVVDRARMTWAFEIDDSPSSEALKGAKNGTKAARGANFTCLLTGAAIDDTHVKAEAMAGRMTNAVNVSLDGMKGTGFFEAKGGDARLRKREELPDNWDPSADHRCTVWEACQHLVKRLSAEDGGIEAAAALYNRLGVLAAPAHALARRLYDICEQRQWASEGRFYNQLHQEWDVIEKRAAALAETSVDLFSR